MFLTPITKSEKSFIVSVSFWGHEYVEFKCKRVDKAVRVLEVLIKVAKSYKKKKPENKVFYKFK